VASSAELGLLLPGELYERADAALYEAKACGGNCVRVAGVPGATEGATHPADRPD
jgi:hypothetical protein